MAHRYLLTVPVYTHVEADAIRAADALEELTGHRALVLDYEARPMAETGVVEVFVTFLAESDELATELRESVRDLPELPPLGDPTTRVLARNVEADDETTEALNQ